MIYFILFIFSYILTFFLIKYAHKNLLLAEVNERSSHSVPTPHGGGIAIAITWFLGLTYLFFLDEIDNKLYYALMVGIIIALVSYMDDLYELSPKIRLMIQSLVAFVGLYILGGFNELNLFFITLDNQYITNIIAFFMIIWFINLYNFLDGIDGYAGSEAIFLGIAGFFFFGGNHFLIFIVSILGFLIWNWHKAKIFMGDVGSTLLGYTVAMFTIYYANIESTNLWIWLILFSLFWFDATLTLFRRYINKEQLSKAHRKHGYQRLVQYGLRHNEVVLFSIIINCVLGCLIYFISDLRGAFIVSLILLYSIIRFIDTKNIF